ncbi:MAG: O-Antigen ligase, partial [Gaiellaceae bacterium]|nr:O-Antigen ligase [Gaiellaceae bacterium]
AGGRALAVALLLVAGAVLVARPPLALGALLATTVLFEADPNGFLPITSDFYGRLRGRIAPTDVLFLLLLAGVLFELGRERRQPRLPGALTLPLLLLCFAILFGIANGYLSGWNQVEALNSTRVFLYLAVLPFLVVNVIRERRHLVAAVAVAAGLAAFKSVEGVVAYSLGAGGKAVSDIGSRIIYLEPTPNWLLVWFLLALVAAVALRVPTPRWALVAAPLAIAALALSFRRSFWIAGVLGALIVVLLAREGARRRIVIPATVAVAAALWSASAIGGSSAPGGQNVFLERAKTLNPASIETRPNDRYRLEERRNVLAAIRERPLSGLGLGVHYRIRYGLSQHPPSAGYYSHTITLTYWLRTGLAGVLAYLALMVTALVTAYRVSRRHPDAIVRAAALGLVGALGGLMVAETTASFTGDDLRLTILLATALGALASASQHVAVDEAGAA